MPDKTLFFLGAGATIDVAPDAPSNKNLVRKAIENLPVDLKVEGLKKFIQDLFVKRSNPQIDNQVWNLLDYMIQQGRGAPGYSLERITELREDLLSLIIGLIDKNLRDISKAPYNNFIQAIKSSLSTIISTNYDIIIDVALLNGIRCCNYASKIRFPLTVENSQEHKKFGLRKPRLAGYHDINTGEIELLKLHGSLNWLYCRKCDEVDLTGPEKGGMHALTGLYCYNENCSNKYEPLLITPTMFKTYDNRFIKETWSHAEQKLISSDNLVFIGYALKEEDYQIRCLLMKALLCRGEAYKKVIVVEAPQNGIKSEYLKEVELKYKDLYGKIDFQPIGFTKFVDTIQSFNLALE